MAILPRPRYARTHFATVDTRLVAFIRLLLATFALVIIIVDPTEPDRLVNLTYGAMAIYTVYSLCLYLLIVYERTVNPRFEASLYWLDTFWYLLLISLSNGTNSIFYFFLFFAIANAAFSGDRFAGIGIALVSSVGMFIIGYATTPIAIGNDLGRSILRPISLLIIGLLLTNWGSYATRSLLRLKLLRDIGTLSNPRFGVSRTLNSHLELIRSFYSARGCLYLSRDKDSGQIGVFSAGISNSKTSETRESFPDGLASKFLELPEHVAAVYESSPAGTIFRARDFHVYDTKLERYVKPDETPFAQIAEALDSRVFITAPVIYRADVIGRVYIHSDHHGCFDRSDIHFLRQAIEQFVPIIENIRLVDRLASDAADEERKKIGRDIHDSIIQPYIGLQLGIDSFATLLETDHLGQKMDPEVYKQIADRAGRLKAMAQESVVVLRNFVNSLADATGEQAPLVNSLTRFATRFSEATAITVTVEVDEDGPIGDRLAAELFQIAAEGLSNIRRHTVSTNAEIRLRTNDNSAIIEIANDIASGTKSDFVPSSIRERAISLGGEMKILHENEKTRVIVEIPL